jgi:ATP-dependent helicase/nuclease subunit A
MSALQEEMKERDRRERLRLLYVAMTRAETWLIVAAAGELSKDEQSDWHQLVENGMRKVGAFSADMPTGTGLAYEFGNWALPVEAPPASADAREPCLEPFFGRAPVTDRAEKSILTPSDLGGPKALSSEKGLSEEAALARGSYIH